MAQKRKNTTSNASSRASGSRAATRKKGGTGVGTRILCGFLAVVVLCGAALSIMEWATPKDWKGRPSLWGKAEQKQPAEPETPNEPNEKNDGGAVVSKAEEHGIELLSARLPRAAYSANGIDAQAETAYQLTATITPSNATNQEVEWTVAWKNAESAFASGKSVSDYVVVQKNAANSLVATVECKAAFGEQIEITVTSQDNTDLSAKCIVDYCKRVTGFSIGGYPSGVTVAWGNFYLNNTPFNVSPEYGIGTVQGTYAYESITFRLSDYVKSNLQSQSDTMIPFGSGTYNGYYWKYTLQDFVTTAETVRVCPTSFMTNVKVYTSSSSSTEIPDGAGKTNAVEAAQNCFHNDVISAILAQHNPPVHLTGEISYSYSYAGQDFSSVYKITSICCAGSSLTTSVTGISVNGSLVL